MRSLIVISSLIAALVGCGKDAGSGGGSCKPLTVTLDGEPIAGLGHGLGYHESTGGYSISVFDHNKTTCEQMMARSRAVPDGEQSVSVGAGGQFGPGLGYEANGQMGKRIAASVKTTPAKVGDPMAICVTGSLDLRVGDHKGKKLVVDGLVEGTYCGERK